MYPVTLDTPVDAAVVLTAAVLLGNAINAHVMASGEMMTSTLASLIAEWRIP